MSEAGRRRARTTWPAHLHPRDLMSVSMSEDMTVHAHRLLDMPRQPTRGMLRTRAQTLVVSTPAAPTTTRPDASRSSSAYTAAEPRSGPYTRPGRNRDGPRASCRWEIEVEGSFAREDGLFVRAEVFWIMDRSSQLRSTAVRIVAVIGPSIPAANGTDTRRLHARHTRHPRQPSLPLRTRPLHHPEFT